MMPMPKVFIDLQVRFMASVLSGVLKSLDLGDKNRKYFSIEQAGKNLGVDFSKLPNSMKIMLENVLRSLTLKPKLVEGEGVEAIVKWLDKRTSKDSVSWFPARVLMQDYTGVPAIVDLASMRDAIINMGGDPQNIKPKVPVSLVIDHSVQVDHYGADDSFEKNFGMDMHRNSKRYEFLKWGARAFSENLRIVPPGKGICHQINLEHLATVVVDDGEYVYPDTLVGLDSHTTMVNGLSVLGWGVGGIEAESVMLGQPISMVVPEVIGVRLRGKLRDGVNATDLVLSLTSILRKKGVVGKFVEYFGEGASRLSLADRATVANMAPEYGATCGFFSTDEQTLHYLRLTGRSEETINLVEKYTKAQGLWATPSESVFTDVIDLDLDTVDTYLAGPKRPQDLLPLRDLCGSMREFLQSRQPKKVKINGMEGNLEDGDIVIAAITSCTNTSNPDAIIGAGLVAKKACELGLTVKKHVKTSLAPGSRAVMKYLHNSGLYPYLEKLGFNLVGYGCTTCIGNSGPFLPAIEEAIVSNDLRVASVLSGNRNFEGRVHPLVHANYLASPALVVALSLAGNVSIDLDKEPIGVDLDGKKVYLKQLMPSASEISALVQKYVGVDVFKSDDVFSGTDAWNNLKVQDSVTYPWDASNLYIQNPPYFDDIQSVGATKPILGAYILALLGDSITTDHISPAGNISKTSPAAQYLSSHKVKNEDFNTYGARRGNHEVMMRGTFANIRIKNHIKGVAKEGGFTVHIPRKKEMSIYDAAMQYKASGNDVIVLAGKEYGSGSSRDWAAKGVMLLGVKAIIAESFERIHRSNLIGMGVLPLEYLDGQNYQSLGFTGHERVDIHLDESSMHPGTIVKCTAHKEGGISVDFNVKSRIDTKAEVEYFKNKGILIHALKELASA